MLNKTVIEELLVKLRQVRANGTRSVEFDAGNGSRQRVEYKTDAEMAAAIADLERQLAATGGRPVHTVHIHSNKGF